MANKVRAATATDTLWVTSVFTVGVWAVHQTVQTSDTPKPIWSVTHIPTGRAVVYELTKTAAITLAQRLFNKAPKLFETLPFKAAIPHEQIPPDVTLLVELAKGRST